MTENLLEVNNLSVKLNKKRKDLIKNVSFSIKQHCSLGIIGESGSGKTVTSKAILKLLNPKIFAIKGQIVFNNQNLMNLNRHQLNNIRGKQIAMIMQNPMTAFAPMLRIEKQVVDTLTFHLQLSKKEAYDKALKEMARINLSNSQKIMHSYPHELSGGMLQRIMIALTLLLEPKLIIADEATTAVDAISEKMILDELKKVKERGISLLIITHDFGVAAALADKLLVMRNGEVIEKGLTNKLLTSPKHFYTKQLVEASLLTKGGENYASNRKYC